MAYDEQVYLSAVNAFEGAVWDLRDSGIEEFEIQDLLEDALSNWVDDEASRSEN